MEFGFYMPRNPHRRDGTTFKLFTHDPTKSALEPPECHMLFQELQTTFSSLIYSTTNSKRKKYSQHIVKLLSISWWKYSCRHETYYLEFAKIIKKNLNTTFCEKKPFINIHPLRPVSQRQGKTQIIYIFVYNADILDVVLMLFVYKLNFTEWQ